MGTQPLRDRAAAAQNGPGTDVARPTPQQELTAKIRRMESEFKLAMPRGMEAAQLIRDAMTVLSQNPRLAECDSKSVLGALMTCAQLGLRPGVLGQAWVIPFKGKGQLVIGYQGLIALAQRSGDIASISARMVHEHDHFDYQFGLDDQLVHRPASGDRGDVIAYYCVVKTKSGGVMWDVLSRADAEVHRDKFAMARDRSGAVIGPWRDHFDAMALKTIIMRVLKLAPRSTELHTAIVADNSLRVDLTPTVPADQVSVPLVGDDDDGIEDADIVDTETGVITDPADVSWPDVAPAGGAS